MTGPLALTAVLLAGCGTSDTNITHVDPHLVVLPDSVDFGDVTVGYSGAAEVTLLNVGLAPLEVSSLKLSGEQASAFHLDIGGPGTLDPDDSIVATVTFTPDTYLGYAATLDIASDDPDAPEVSVPLTGVGAYAPTPEIVIDPLAIDFGVVAAGSTSVKVLNVSNEGRATLTLGAVIQHGSGAFSILGADPGGFSIPPGQAQQIVWQYSPTTSGGDNGTFVIPSDDPDEPELTVTLLGNGGGDFEYPEAVIDCPGTVAPREVVTLDGRASTDPGGRPLDYRWTLDGIPAGSAVSDIVDDGESVAQITTDIAGEYTIGLVVTNPDGVSSAKRVCKLDAVPKEQLHVELSWDLGHSDLDLHLLAEGGNFFEKPLDCNYCNQIPDWGVPIVTDDDPSLDLDNTVGYGPENINIDVPVDGTYTILVHYFDSPAEETANATVRVYSHGILVAEATHAIDLDMIWKVGTVNWPDGTVGMIDDYYDNVQYDADGNPVLDEDGDPLPGVYDCWP